MLKKSQRLNLKESFSWVAAGKRSSNNLFKLFFRFGQNEEAKIGIATAKSNFKKAVDRNRARRIMSKAFEETYRQLPVGVNIIALPRESVLSLNADQVKESLEELLTKSGLIKKDDQKTDS